MSAPEVTGLEAAKVPGPGKLTSGPGIGLQSAFIQSGERSQAPPGAKTQCDPVEE